MGKAIDITGQRFGRLVAVKCVGAKRGFRLWELVCDCGTVVEKTSAAVIHGQVSSCGCYRSERISSRTSANIAGERFGRIVAVSRIGPDVHGKVQWRCRCDCGSDCVITASSLRKGTKSCGCLQREASAARQRAKALPLEVKQEHIRSSRAKQREKRKGDPLALMHARLSRLHRHALVRIGSLKHSPTLEAFGYTALDFVKHIERQFVDGMGWHNMREWQVDHIIPISTAKTVADVIALNQLSNLRPMWAKENNAKKAKIDRLL